MTTRQERRVVSGMTKDEAAALGREVSATAVFRGHLQRLAGGSPEGPSWGLRVTSVLTGGGGLVRSREAWECYHERVQQEVRAMVDGKNADGLWGALSGTGPVSVVAGRSTGLEVTMSEDGPTVVPDFAGDRDPVAPAPRGSPPERYDLDKWRAYTLGAIAQAERDAERLTRQAAEKQAQATRRRRAARELRRALELVHEADEGGVGAGGQGERGTLRPRILAWVQAHGGELVVAACAQDTGLSVKRVSDVASQISRDGRMERVGKGQYRLVPQ